MYIDVHMKALGWVIDRTGFLAIPQKSPRALARMRSLVDSPVPTARMLRRARARGVRIGRATVPGRDGGIQVRTYRPVDRDDLPVIVAVHGGGWIISSLNQADARCIDTAARVGALVIAVDYRLAPECPFPAGLHDCYDVTAWAAEHAGRWGGRTSEITVLGDSAGGNLAAAVTLLARDTGLLSAITRQVLIYPALDLTGGSPSLFENDGAPVLTLDDAAAYVRHYLGPHGDETDPLASPLLAADQNGLPPALIITGQLDPLRDDGARYAEKLAAHGVPVRFTEYAGAPHGFLDLPWWFAGSMLARQANAEIDQYLTHAIGRGFFPPRDTDQD